MSNQILSQDEIDTLLGGLSGGAVAAAAPASAGPAADDAIKVDFFNQDRIVRGGMPTLEVIHDRFSRLLRTGLTQTIRRAVDVQILTYADVKFGEFIRTLSTPSSLHVLKLDPLKGYGLLVLPGKLIYTLIDIFFGGSGRDPQKSDARDFTLIEQKIITNLTEVIERQYAEAWRPVHPLNVQATGSETNPQFISIAQPSDSVTAVDYEVLIDGAKCGLSVCLPYSTIEPIKDTLKGSVISEALGDENSWGRRLSQLLQNSLVEIRAMLGSSTISVRDLMNLKTGDVIQLREDFEHPVGLIVEGVPKFWGTVGSHKSARAVQITGIHDEEERKRKNV